MHSIINIVRRRVNLPLRRIDSEFMSIDQFLKLTDEERSDISSCDIVPASINGEGYGGFKVVWKTPRFKA